MLSIFAVLALAQAHADKVTVHTRVFSLSPSIRVEIEGTHVEQKRLGTYITGLELAIGGEVDALVKNHSASEVNDQDIRAFLGQKVSRTFFKSGENQTIEVLAEGASTTGSLGSSYGLDLFWKFGNNDRVFSTDGISHHFDLHQGEAGLILLPIHGARWMMEVTLSKD